MSHSMLDPYIQRKLALNLALPQILDLGVDEVSKAFEIQTTLGPRAHK